MSGGVETVAVLEEQKRGIAFVDDHQLPRPQVFSRRIPELDGLRGIAIGMVMVYHYVSLTVTPGSPGLLGFLFQRTRLFWCGVDLFFVLSGFLIGGILLDSRDSANYFKTFYIRRFCRIVPIYLLFLGFVAIAHQFVSWPVGLNIETTFAGKLPWYWYLSFTQNLWMAKWNTTGSLVLVITWSLAVEEQFYLLLPAVIRFVRRSRLPYVFITGIWLAPIVRIFIALHFPESRLAPYLLLPCRMDALFLGALCAFYLREPERWKRLARRRTWIWVALLILLAGTFALNEAPISVSMQSWGYDWMALLFAVLLILSLTDSEGFLGKALRWQWLRGLGTIAYSVYLFHLLVYGLFMTLVVQHGHLSADWRNFGVMVIAVATTITFARLSWRYFESPIVRWGHNWQY